MYWLEDNNFIALLKKINSYFTSQKQRNEFIVGVNIDTETHNCMVLYSPLELYILFYIIYYYKLWQHL